MKRQKGTTPRGGNSGRRGFLRTLVFGGAATTLAAATARFASEPAAPASRADTASTPPSEATGYHVTPHIEQYYRKAAL